MAPTVGNPLAVWKTWAQSLGWEDPMEEGMATHSSILAWSFPLDRGAWWATAMGLQGVEQNSLTKHTHTTNFVLVIS